MGRRRWIASIALVLSVGAIAAVIAIRYYPAYRSALEARNDLRAAQTLLRNERLDADAADLALAESQLIDAEAGFLRAHHAFDDAILEAGYWVPVLGDSLEATATLTQVGLDGTQIGLDAIDMTRTFQQRRADNSQPLTEQTLDLLEELDEPMSSIKDRLGEIRSQQAAVADMYLPPSLDAAAEDLDDEIAELDDLVRTYEDLSDFLPDFLGFNGTRSYLLLAQNNGELLPTGGLISVYGVISIRNGRIEQKQFGDALTFGGKWLERTGDYVEPPPPLKSYLLKDVSWNLAVSNWSPHFPTAALEADRFFRLAGGEPVDGVIAINIHTIEELLRVTGPVGIPSYNVTVDAEHAFDVIEEHTRSAPDPEGDRKAFVGQVADAIFSELMHLPSSKWTSLIDAMERLRDQHEITFFSHDAAMQRLSGRLELDGALDQAPGDYMMLVDANVHSTKLNVVLEQDIDLTVEVDHGGAAYHRTRVSYRNNLSEWAEGRDEGLVQRLMLDGLYGAYVRLLAPSSSLIESVELAEREVGPEEIATEQGKSVFGRYFALPRDQETELTFTYKTFGAVYQEDDAFVYRLLLQRQPGTSAIPVRLTVTLPDEARVQSSELDGAPLDSLSSVETDLAEDRELVVRYRIES